MKKNVTKHAMNFQLEENAKLLSSSFLFFAQTIQNFQQRFRKHFVFRVSFNCSPPLMVFVNDLNSYY